MLIKPKWPPLLHFFGTMRHCLKEKFFNISSFFFKKSLLRFLSLRYSADFRRSRLVFSSDHRAHPLRTNFCVEGYRYSGEPSGETASARNIFVHLQNQTRLKRPDDIFCTNIFFRILLMSLLFNVFDILQQAGFLKSPKGPSFTIFVESEFRFFFLIFGFLKTIFGCPTGDLIDFSDHVELMSIFGIIVEWTYGVFWHCATYLCLFGQSLFGRSVSVRLLWLLMLKPEAYPSSV